MTKNRCANNSNSACEKQKRHLIGQSNKGEKRAGKNMYPHVSAGENGRADGKLHNK